MKIRFASDIVKDMEDRGSIVVPEGCVTGEAFESWLYEEPMKNGKSYIEASMISNSSFYFNTYHEELGEAA